MSIFFVQIYDDEPKSLLYIEQRIRKKDSFAEWQQMKRRKEAAEL